MQLLNPADKPTHIPKAKVIKMGLIRFLNAFSVRSREAKPLIIHSIEKVFALHKHENT